MLPWSCRWSSGHGWRVVVHPTQWQSVMEQVLACYVHHLSWLLKSGRHGAVTMTVAFPSATRSCWKGARGNKQYLPPVNVLVTQKCVHKLWKGQSLLLWQAQLSFFTPCLLLSSCLWGTDYISRRSQAWSSSSYCDFLQELKRHTKFVTPAYKTHCLFCFFSGPPEFMNPIFMPV